MSDKNIPNYDYSDLLKRNNCPICTKMDCPFLTESKYEKEMRILLEMNIQSF